ncbi:MAG: hypothetical protein ACLGPL_01030 [Acidobacteriota bacterium]
MTESKLIRGLEAIGERISSQKPIRRDGVFDLIKKHKLPAVKKPVIGWVVYEDDLMAWLQDWIQPHC